MAPPATGWGFSGASLRGGSVTWRPVPTGAARPPGDSESQEVMQRHPHMWVPETVFRGSRPRASALKQLSPPVAECFCLQRRGEPEGWSQNRCHGFTRLSGSLGANRTAQPCPRQVVFGFDSAVSFRGCPVTQWGEQRGLQQASLLIYGTLRGGLRKAVAVAFLCFPSVSRAGVPIRGRG